MHKITNIYKKSTIIPNRTCNLFICDCKTQEADKEEIVNNLKAYCGMDSYAMMVIYKWLLQFINNV